MPTSNEKSYGLVRKIGSLAGIIVGFLAAAAGYRYGSLGLISIGATFVIVGLLFLAGVVMRRHHT